LPSAALPLQFRRDCLTGRTPNRMTDVLLLCLWKTPLWAALVNASGFRLGDAFCLTLAAQISHELREDSEHVEERLPCSRAGVDWLLGGLQGHSAPEADYAQARERPLRAVDLNFILRAMNDTLK
jgi:hypothetical protein